jgi:heme-degrading monooxygenase HmoA
MTQNAPAPQHDSVFVPPPGCYVVIFTSLRSPDDGVDYAATATAMMALAQQQPGYLGVVSARTPGAEGITLSYWRSEHDIAAWKAQADHQQAQSQGRSTWYSAYSLVVARVERAHAYAPPA